MHINDDYSLPSDLQDSYEDHHESIKAENTYEVNSNTDSEEQGERYMQSFEIDHSIDLSMEHDTFLEKLQLGRLSEKIRTVHMQPSFPKETQYLMVNKDRIQMTLLQSQSVEEVITFTNIACFPIRMKFNECPFQIHSEKSLSFVQARQLEVIIEAYQEVSITFLISAHSQHFGDIIETVVIISEFVGREESISPLEINFKIHYIVPTLKLKFQGRSESLAIARSRMAVARLRANKFGEYCLEVGLGSGSPKMSVNVETRGKMTSFTSNVILTDDSFSSIKLRKKGATHLQDQQKYVLLLKSTQSKLCFVIGIQFLS